MHNVVFREGWDWLAGLHVHAAFHRSFSCLRHRVTLASATCLPCGTRRNASRALLLQHGPRSHWMAFATYQWCAGGGLFLADLLHHVVSLVLEEEEHTKDVSQGPSCVC